MNFHDSTVRRLAFLKVGSCWLKPLSGKRYEVVAFEIWEPTNELCVTIRRIGSPDDKRVSRPLGAFLGEVKNPKTSEYGPRFVPYAESVDDAHSDAQAETVVGEP